LHTYIDGSHGEGGGQILRTALALSVLSGKPLEIGHIRAGRRRPGLMAQHVMSVQAISEICGARVEGLELGSQRIRLLPGTTKGGRYVFDVARVRASAGSTGMIFQTLAPVLGFAEEPSDLILKGGTHTQWAPPIHYLSEVFLPTVYPMGFRAEIGTERWGWYPEGGGVVHAHVATCRKLKGLVLEENGKLMEIRGQSVVSNLPLSIAERQRNRVLMRLRQEKLEGEIALLEAPSSGRGTFVFLLARFERGMAGFSALGARGKPAEQVAEEAVDALLTYLHSGAAVDPYLSDQILLYMALAEGTSAFTTSQVTSHLLTNIWVLKHFLPLRCEVRGSLGQPGHVHIEGTGFRG
jgi:RNA 3'-terminal phosphate cyclase (ATP)